MAVLSDSDIIDRLSSGSLRIGDFNEQNLTPNGYDVTIAEILLPAENKKHSQGVVEVLPMTLFVIGTREYLEVPPDLVGEIWIRTTWVRKGVLSSFGRIDAGFHGNLTFSALNASAKPVELKIGDSFAQVVFEELKSLPKKAYKERSGNYHGQTGITLEPKGESQKR